MEPENPIVITPSLSMVPKWKFMSSARRISVIVNPGIIIALASWASGQLFKQIENGLAFYTLGSSGRCD
jgi:hypothetical protein